jgi:hypothetical protein
VRTLAGGPGLGGPGCPWVGMVSPRASTAVGGPGCSRVGRSSPGASKAAGGSRGSPPRVSAVGRLLIVGSVTVAAGAGLVVTAAPAGAATISAPSVVTSQSTVTITAKTDAVQAAKLLFNGKVVASAGQLQLGSTLTYKFSTSSMRNGSYSAVLQEELLVLPWHNAASATIALRVPPAPPSGVAAHLVSGRTVHVTWARGAEPDLTSYSVVSTAGGGAGLGVGAACGSGGCSAAVTVPGDATVSAGFAVVAHRSDGAGGTLASGASPTVYVRVPGSVGSGAGGTASGGPAGSGSGSRGGVAGRGGAGTGSYGSAYLRMQALSGESSGLVLPTVGPASGLALPISGTKAAQSRSRRQGAAGGWYPALAAVLILLLAAAHAGAWSWRKNRASRASAPRRSTVPGPSGAPRPSTVPRSSTAQRPSGAASTASGAATEAVGISAAPDAPSAGEAPGANGASMAAPDTRRQVGANGRGNGHHSRDLSPARHTQPT